mmetsp:Transcript_53885/g.127228  ORF Transcript_53885/g.127228 Transcript_53885/m.127228 type:complete len:343 (-) Transcript_53885:37-1065(-)
MQDLYISALKAAIGVLPDKPPRVGVSSLKKKGVVYGSQEHAALCASLCRKVMLLGKLFSTSGLHQGAAWSYEQAALLAHQTVSASALEQNLFIAEASLYMGIEHHLAHDLPRAFEALHKALSLREAALGPEHEDVSIVCQALGDVYRNDGNYKEAMDLFARAVAVRRRLLRGALGVSTASTATTHDLKVAVWPSLDDSRSTDDAPRQHAVWTHAAALGKVLNSIGLVRRVLSDLEGAAQAHNEAISVSVFCAGGAQRVVAIASFGLAEIYKAQRDAAKAMQWYQEAHSIWKSMPGQEANIAAAEREMGGLNRRLGHQTDDVTSKAIFARNQCLGVIRTAQTK